MATPRLVKTTVAGVYRRGPSYVVTYRAGGKQRREHVKTMAQAKKLKAMRTADAARGELFAQTRITFHEYAAQWIERYQGSGRGIRENTRAEYKRQLQQYAFQFFPERKRLCQITPRDVADFIAWLCDEREQGKRLSDATVRRIICPVRACLRTAVREGVIRSNPAAELVYPHRPTVQDDDPDQRRALTREELRTFLEIVHPDFQLMFRFLAVTGLRIGEAIALQWQHLRLEGSAPRVRVRRTHYKGAVKPPKSKYGRRDVPLPAEIVSALREHRKDSEWQRDEDLVFPSRAGTPLDPQNTMRRYLKVAAEEAGVPWAGFHTFRHTCASMLFERGANAKQVQRWLGHHSASFTLDTYIHLLTDGPGEPLSLVNELAQGQHWTTQVNETGLDANVGPDTIPASRAGFRSSGYDRLATSKLS